MKVQDLVNHILQHIDAEAKDSDPSQVTGVATRAKYVRDTLEGFKTDTRELSKNTILGAISNASSLSASQTSFKKTIANIQTDNGIRPQLAIQTWVGKAKEKNG